MRDCVYKPLEIGINYLRISRLEQEDLEKRFIIEMKATPVVLLWLTPFIQSFTFTYK